MKMNSSSEKLSNCVKIMCRVVVVLYVSVVVLVLMSPGVSLVCEVSAVRAGSSECRGLKAGAGADHLIDGHGDILEAQYNFEKLIPEVQKLLLQYSRISSAAAEKYCEPAINDDRTTSSYYKPRSAVVFGPTGIKLKPPSGPNPEGNFMVNDASIETGAQRTANYAHVTVSESSGFGEDLEENSPLKTNDPIGKTRYGLLATISSDLPTEKNSADEFEQIPMDAATAGLEHSSRRNQDIPVSNAQAGWLATDENSLSTQQKSAEAFDYPRDIGGADIWPRQVRFRNIPLAGQGRKSDRAGDGFIHIAADPVG